MNPYISTTQFFARHNETLPKPHGSWRLLVEPVSGAIKGIPAFAGTVYVTNGILCAIETASGKLVYGHFDWFVKNKEVKEGKKTKRQESEIDYIF